MTQEERKEILHMSINNQKHQSVPLSCHTMSPDSAEMLLSREVNLLMNPYNNQDPSFIMSMNMVIAAKQKSVFHTKVYRVPLCKHHSQLKPPGVIYHPAITCISLPSTLAYLSFSFLLLFIHNSLTLFAPLCI